MAEVAATSFRAYKNRLLIKRFMNKEHATYAGIIIPDDKKRREHHGNLGQVVALGTRGAYNNKVGEFVYFDWTPEIKEIGGGNSRYSYFCTVPSEQILAKIPPGCLRLINFA